MPFTTEKAAPGRPMTESASMAQGASPCPVERLSAWIKRGKACTTLCQKTGSDCSLSDLQGTSGRRLPGPR